jgi:endonuclease/exonuclease/phosphatase family metal-dependent hydrolase
MAPVDRMTLRVLTLNVWNLEGPSDRQARMVDGVAALEPDLVALQEVRRTAGHDQLAAIVEACGLEAGYHQLDVLDAGPEAARAGTALASRWAPTGVEGVVLAPGEGDGRCALAATVPLPTGVDLLFMAVKPSWRLDAEARRVAEARAIVALEARLRRPAPTIVAGDFDAAPDSDSLRYLTGRAVVDGHSVRFHDAWEVGGDGGPGHTWTSANPLAVPGVEELVGQSPHGRRIDYVLVGSRDAHPRVAGRVRRCEVVLAAPAVSDHYGVLAEIEIERLG